MRSFLEGIRDTVRIADVVDIILVTVFLYWLLLWFKRTASRPVVVGVAVLSAIYMASLAFEMYLTSYIFSGIFAILLFSMVIVFQEDVRRTFAKVAEIGQLRNNKQLPYLTAHLDGLIEVAFNLAAERRGALIVLKGLEDLDYHIEGGISLSSNISKPLLFSIFDPHSPGHDGAVIIEKGEIVRFSAHLPLSKNSKEIAGRGTRHTAALGLSECADCLVIAVSEERGVVTLAKDGGLLEVGTPVELKDHIEQFIIEKFPPPSEAHWTKSFGKHLKTKTVALVLACVAWYLAVYQVESVQRVFVVPIEYRNMSKNVEFDENAPSEAKITLSGSEAAFQFLAPSTLKVSIDLGPTVEGTNLYTITENNVKHPPTLTVYRIEPRVVRVNVLPK